MRPSWDKAFKKSLEVKQIKDCIHIAKQSEWRILE